MLLNKKILIFGVLFLLLVSTVYAEVCEVDRIKQVLKKILFLYYTEPESVPLNKDEVKDMLVFYLSINDQNLTVDCSAFGSRSSKPISDVVNEGENVPDKIPVCADGTKYGECSKSRPAYCYAGAIYSRCGLCGCPTNSVCGKSEKCAAIAQNITCFKDFDCGQSAFVGDYYCVNNYIYRNYLNYSCIDPGKSNSRCAASNGTMVLTNCNANLNQTCAAGQNYCNVLVINTSTTTTNQTTPTGICLVRDSYTTVPVFSAPDLGKGYNKLSKPGINTISGLQSACSQADYTSLLTTYCTQNSNPIQQQVMTYDNQGNYQSLSCGAFGCNYVSCPATANQTNQTTLPAPYAIRAGWGISNDNTKKSSLFFHAINFGYSDPLPSAFRVYMKKPGEAAFSRAAEFTNLSAPCQIIVSSGNWLIYRRCDSTGTSTNDWKIDSPLTPITTYSLGEYRFQMAAVDASGKEATTPEFGMYNLQPLTVLSPASSQSPVTTVPTFQWTVSSGWTQSPASYLVSIYDDAKFGEPWIVHSAWVNVPTSLTTASYVYNGPALDPAKKYIVRIYGLYRSYPATICPSCDYISMDTSTQTFWVSGNQTNQTTQQPDLIVSDITFTPSNPTTADYTKVNVTIKNIGTATAWNFSTKVEYVGGQSFLFGTGALQPGATTQPGYLSNYWPAGTNTFTATVDINNIVIESNENNNVLSKSVIVTSPSINQTNLTAPTLLEVYWSSGGTGWPPVFTYSHGIKFSYTSTLSNVQEFRLYEKKPGDSSFNLAATFSNPSSIGTTCSGYIRSAPWNLYYYCPPVVSPAYWIASIVNGQQYSYFPVGQYSFYVAAVDTSGVEKPSSSKDQYALQPTTIISPIGAQSSLNPTLRWTVGSDWPSAPNPYKIRIADNNVVGLFVYDPPVEYASSPEGSKLYDGPSLNPAKTYTAYIDGSNVIGGKYYISMSTGSKVFSVSNQTILKTYAESCTNGVECKSLLACISDPLDNSVGKCGWWGAYANVTQCSSGYYPSTPCMCGNIAIGAGACNHGIFYWPPSQTGKSIGSSCTDGYQCSTGICIFGLCSYAVRCSPSTPGYCHDHEECVAYGASC